MIIMGKKGEKNKLKIVEMFYEEFRPWVKLWKINGLWRGGWEGEDIVVGETAYTKAQESSNYIK